jgi:hypothetical protein
VATVAVVAAAVPLKPAAADDGRHDDRNWKGGYHRPWHPPGGWYRGGSVYVYGGPRYYYAPPPVYYAPPPPPRVYYPPPAYYAPPSISFGINVR